MKKNLASIIVILSSMLFLNGCNTVQGMGEDLKQGGQAIKRAASNGASSNKSTVAPTVQTASPSPVLTGTATTRGKGQ